MVFERRSRNYLASPDGAADPPANVSTVSIAVHSLWSTATPVYHRRHLILLIALLLIISNVSLAALSLPKLRKFFAIIAFCLDD
jgi:hypothetical protein